MLCIGGKSLECDTFGKPIHLIRIKGVQAVDEDCQDLQLSSMRHYHDTVDPHSLRVGCVFPVGH